MGGNMVQRQHVAWSDRVSPQQFGTPDRAAGGSPPLDDHTWRQTVERGHAAHWARQGHGALPMNRPANAEAVVAAAARRAKSTGRSTAEVLAEAGFHPVTGMSMRPAPARPEWETNRAGGITRLPQ